MPRLPRALLVLPLLVMELLLALAVALMPLVMLDMRSTPPLLPGEQAVIPARERMGNGGWRTANGWIAPTPEGLWEAYVEGGDLERGLAIGTLAQELIRKQEELFVQRIRVLVPDEGKLRWIRHFITFFNRDLEEHVPLEYRREIYGESRAFDPAFDAIGNGYERALNYHAAHDIGHALQDLAFVGCTSFAAWGPRTPDGHLLIGRNFDFHMGDDFACDKLVLAMRPDSGHPFVIVTWAGMLGAVSGMNLEGLTVTINASRSALPTGARTPISLLAREILQHAATVDEAVAIAGRREVFVSESILVGSARDGRAVVIEKAPDGMGVHDPGNGLVVCANHYQSDTFRDSPVNQDNLRESDSMARFKRMQELTGAGAPLTPRDAARILRERRGPDGQDVGLGNPIAIDQLIAHHSVIMEPVERRLWLGTGPYTLGPFRCYDLRAIFARGFTHQPSPPLHMAETLPADTLLDSPAMDDLVWHRAMRSAMLERRVTGRAYPLSADDEAAYIRTDPHNAITYSDLAWWYRAQGDAVRAAGYFREALARTVSSAAERRELEKALEECARN